MRRHSRRSVIVLAITAMMMGVVVAPAGAGDQVCTKGDVQRMVAAMPQAFATQSAAAADCQFRLYDVASPHVFSENDWILAGILQWSPRDVLDELGLKRADGVDYLTNFVVDSLFWGPKGGPLEEISLTHTNYRGNVFDDAGGRLVINHRYHIFSPGSLDEGEYEWKWVYDDSLFGDHFETYGEVHIVEGD